MLTRIQALNYRCLRYIDIGLDRFHIMIGPNASGKTTFLDVVAFVSQLLTDGVDAAIEDRADTMEELTWRREGSNFELALEASIPDGRLPDSEKSQSFNTVRYDIRIGLDDKTDFPGIISEKVLLKQRTQVKRDQLDFPLEPDIPESLIDYRGKAGEQWVLSKSLKGRDNFYSELRRSQPSRTAGYFPSIRLGPKKSTFTNLPDDEENFPVSTWFRSLITDKVQTLTLNSLALRKPSPPSRKLGYLPDGSNLPWVINNLKKNDSDGFKDWLSHLKMVLPDLEDVTTIERPEDKFRYLNIHYSGGLKVPSWLVSDGTLRLLALTIPAYIKGLDGIILVEEPENGLNPGVIDAAFQSLSSVYDAQVLLASHSPILLSLAEPNQVLCFRKTESGATDIIHGNLHPRLRDWRGEPNLSVMFASGVL